MQRPNKPRADFPMFANNNGQWCKKVNGRPYYFGSWTADPKGTEAVKELANRLPGILAGTDHLRHLAASGGKISVGELMGKYLSQRRLDTKAGTLSRTTYGDYATELEKFTDWVKGSTAVAALRPEHFTGYSAHLIETRKLMSHARKRVQGYVRAMFRWGSKHVGDCPLPTIAFTTPNTTPEAIQKEKARAGLTDHSERVVTGAEIDTLLAKANVHMKAIVLLGINCGLGPADIGRMKWKHVSMGAELDLGRAVLNYPRHKTGRKRMGYLWKLTRAVLEEVKKLPASVAAIEKGKEEANVFVNRNGKAYYREEDRLEKNAETGKTMVVGTRVYNLISGKFTKHAEACGLKGLRIYRLRHSFKTHGKKAKDRDALNLCMGHRRNSWRTPTTTSRFRSAGSRRCRLK
jgi:integrase